MKRRRRHFLQIAGAAVTAPAFSRRASALDYPSRPITLIVPFPPGGGADAIGRIVVEGMRASLGQPIVIEIVAGANGSIGTGRATRATPDGYTLLVGLWNTHVANGALYALPYDVLKDFEPIALLASNPELILAKKAMPGSDLKGLIAWLKANPQKASVGTAGVGSPGHVAGIFFQNITGTRYQLVPYRGGSQAMQDLVAGQIETAIIGLGREPQGGLVAMPDGFMTTHRASLISAAARNNVPAVSFFARDGGLLSYGVDLVDIWRRVAAYVDRILRGANPGDLPVQFPVKYEMVVNLKTAKALGLTVPQSILLRADEVIE